MAILGAEESIPLGRALVKELGDMMDTPTTVLVKSMSDMDNVARNQLVKLLKAVKEEFQPLNNT